MKKLFTRHFRDNLVTTLLFLLAFAAAVLFIMPTVLTISNSFMTEKEITANYGAMIDSASADKKTYISEELNLKFIPDKVSPQQYISVLFKSPDYLLKFWNSVILVVPITLFQVVLAAVTAYGFSRYRGRLREIIFFAYIILMLMPYQVTLVPNYLVSDWLGILGTRWAIILPGIFSPFSVYLLTKVMRRIPKAYYEAARLDGAGELQIFFQICMPLCRSSMLSVGLLVFIDYWNMVEQPLILLKDEAQYPLSVFLSQINTG
ncbi:MAG: carbohydrate ABC transporter permease, partial [Oscillospiraceae bacterium]|nr:carbohydrate ABC transporter permease [Oscillospiraceae bacterium]